MNIDCYCTMVVSCLMGLLGLERLSQQQQQQQSQQQPQNPQTPNHLHHHQQQPQMVAYSHHETDHTQHQQVPIKQAYPFASPTCTSDDEEGGYYFLLQNNQWKPPHLTQPKTPPLKTSLRAGVAWPPLVKICSIQLENKALKFKAMPLNKDIFETKERIALAASICVLFDKLSPKSKTRQASIPRNSIPNPFHLQTEQKDCGRIDRNRDIEHFNLAERENMKPSLQVEIEACTPKPLMSTQEKMASDQKHQTAKKTASMARNTLTIPKEPELETASRVRPARVKSAAELEEEMMATLPKFKATPINKKIFEAPTPPALPRSTPKPTEPKTPVLQTSLRARPPKVKSSIELEQEEFEKAPKFKARPLNKKIFESKGDIGISSNAKKQVTIPQEFHFATEERIPLAASVCDSKLSPKSEISLAPVLGNTIPNPFHFQTEERGAEKERKLAMEIKEKRIEEERARIPKANLYPYTTDNPLIASKPETKPCTKPEPFLFRVEERGAEKERKFAMELKEKRAEEERAKAPKANLYPHTTYCPVIPPKPESKPCTKPKPFQLETLTRHEGETQREMEERQRKEKEEAQMKMFKAQPILKEDPNPIPERVHKPPTQVQEVNLHVDHRAEERAEFNKRIKEKEMMYKRFKEKWEAARKREEEKALKQLRRRMVPHARPVPKFCFSHKNISVGGLRRNKHKMMGPNISESEIRGKEVAG